MRVSVSAHPAERETGNSEAAPFACVGSVFEEA